MEVKQNHPRRLRRESRLRMLLIVVIIILVNVLSSNWFTRIDLTGDRRFTLSESSRHLVGNLKDVVYIKVYIEGDFPPGFRRLGQATRELLDELRTYSKGNLDYEFINPSAGENEEENRKVYAQLYQKGIQPTTLEERTGEGLNRRYVFPGALVSFSNQEIGVNLLSEQIGAPSEVLINNSVQNLEYEICNAIRKVTNPLKPVVGFLEGHGEFDEKEVFDISRVLGSSYEVSRIRLDGKLDRLNKCKVLVIAGPDSVFDEKDKFIIDQFIMKGGRVAWFLDGTDIQMDSLRRSGETMALAREVQISDMLFRYGARVNYNLVQDMIASVIPVVTGMVGNQPRQQLLPWYYYPLLTPESRHPIANNLNAIRLQFVSSVDTLGDPSIRKTVLLSSSRYSKRMSAPVRVSLGIMQFKPEPAMFPERNIPLVVLLEGSFTSVYTNRIPATIESDSTINFQKSSEPTKIIVSGDADIIRNEVRNGGPEPLGYDRNTRATYGNKDFIRNCIDYLADDSGLMSLRNKVYRIRLLDPARIDESEQSIRLVNVAFPIFLVIIGGGIKVYRRRMRYSKK